MSLISPEDLIKKATVLGIVEGRIGRLIESKDGKRWGFELVELIKAQSGASWDRIWTVWTDNTNIKLDDHVIVTGDCYWKYEEYQLRNEAGELYGDLRAKVQGHIHKPHIKPAFKQPETESLPF
jgi:hypothetical protein